MAGPALTLSQALNRALASYRAGKLVETQKLCQQMIAAKPDFFEAFQLLAVVQVALGNPDLALATCDRALALRPDDVAMLNNRGVALRALKRWDEALASYDRALARRAGDADALNNRGNILRELKRFDEALASYDRALAARPDYIDAINNRGVTLGELGRDDEALASFERVLAARPGDAEALGNCGNLLHKMGRFGEALERYDRALAARPNYPETYYNRGAALRALERFDEALASYDRALALRPNYAEAHNNRGNVLQDLKRPEEALASYDRALAARPDDAAALGSRGNVLQQLKRPDEALASYDRAVAARPDAPDALNNRGVVLYELGRFEEALANFDRALVLRPDYGDVLFNRGNVLQELKRLEEALASHERALALRPDHAAGLNNRGNTLAALKRPAEALTSYDRAMASRADYGEALNNRGNVLQELNRLDEALASYDRALEIGNANALGGAANCAAKLCDWDRRTQFAAELPAHIAGGKSSVSPFMLLGYSDDPALQLQCAKRYMKHRVPQSPVALSNGPAWRHDKIRVAYLSADFRNHPMTSVITGLLEKHDRSAFEVSGISFGVDDGSDIRKRVVAAFDRFHDVARRGDREIATLLHDLEIDIAVDLMGYTKDARPGILAHRPAPIQVSYMGFPGTMGTPLVDYIIADKIVAPFEHAQFFTEKIVHLPDGYWVNDDKRRHAEATPTRREMGLPEQGFVFCCFNNNWKITPAMFDIWMRLLHRVEGSVLWLLRDNDGAERNLRQEAARRGIDPSRLVFAARIPLEAHLARHRLADLFLDTLPYNAHTTASDALWLGLPVVTSMGQTFAARVAASILHAIGMPELIAADLAGYEALALRLAHDPALLASTKTKLARNRDTHPLFDTGRFARHIEDAYRTMWDIHQRGETPRSFAVPPNG